MEGKNANSSTTGKSSPDDGVYYDPLEDPTRPRYPRPPGEIGIVIDVYDAVPVNSKEFHSHHVLLTNVTDRLLDELRTFPLEHIKGVFVENDLLHGIIFEKIHRGIILSVSVESPEALDALWAAHAREDICRLLQETLATPEVAETVGVKRMQLRVRIWDDERDACREELVERCHSKRPLTDRPTALAMVDKVKKYKKKIPEQIWQLRDEQAKFEASLSEMLRCLKSVLPQNRQTIANLDEYDQCSEKLKEKGINMAPFKNFRNIIEFTKEVLAGITKSIFYPISQIHTCLESERQRQHKKNIRVITQSTQEKLRNDFALSGLRHPEWHNRLLANEERFLGFVCLIPTVIDCVVDIDECLDEYMSGLTK